jgi:tRNA (mo5U34)-methyltransferase
VDQQEVRDRINQFPVWHYEFNLCGVRTPIRDAAGGVNRHEQRRRYFFDQLVALYGGSLKGKRVLDLGCNAGFWSLLAAQAGCDFVLGVDGRQMHVDQAEFVFECNNIARDRYSFLCGNLFELDVEALGSFDIVLCLGLLYHVSKPVELLEILSPINTDILVIDTELTPVPGRWIRVRKEPLDVARAAVDYEIVFCPNREVVLDLVRQFGYSAIVLKPNITDYSGMIDYEIGRRRAFICAKKTDISSLPRDREITIPTPVGEVRRLWQRNRSAHLRLGRTEPRVAPGVTALDPAQRQGGGTELPGASHSTEKAPHLGL